VQVPLPEQNAVAVRVDPVHDAAAQLTVVPASAQAPAVQAPVFPQVVVMVQRLCGSAVPSVTTLQAPALPETLQDWQVGQLELLQQTPSVQLALAHSWFARQATPFALTGRQAPPVPLQ
jgi:hypothetical protein